MDILFREGSKKNTVRLRQETIKDLALQEILDNITETESEMLIVKDIITNVPGDIEDIRYRQDIMRDLAENESLTEELTEAVGLIRTLKDYGSKKSLMMQNDTSLYELLENLRELSVYVNVTEQIVNCLNKSELKSAGLISMRDALSKIVGDEHFDMAKKDINTMLEHLSNVRGAMVGVNFTPDLDVELVSIVEFVPYRIRSKYTFAEIAASLSNIMGTAQSTNTMGRPYAPTRVLDPLLVSMTPLIEKHLKRHYIRLKRIISKYVGMDSSSVTEMYEGLIFYICMTRFGKRLQAEGQEICFPELTDERGCFSLKNLYNVRLFFAQEKNIVKNDFAFSPQENLYILTGPNRGGKTIIEQALGIISVMAASGSFVNASDCKGQPFANILTHFPIDENLTINYGRLGEEAVRIREIVKETDNRTLILFNETYSTTSAVDGLYLSKDLLRILKEIGSAVIFNTHIHEVARIIDEMNQWDGDSCFVSLVMEIKDNVNTFHVKRSAPESKSYARNIAEKYGITYEQMKNNE